MHNEIDFAPFLAEHVEHRVDGGGISHVAVTEQDAAEFVSQWLDPFLQRVTLPRQRDLRARRMASLGNAPGNRTVIGDTENNAALALHQSRDFRHPLFRSSFDRWLEVHQPSDPVQSNRALN